MIRKAFLAFVSLSLIGSILPQTVLCNEQTAIENIRKHGGTVRSVASDDNSKEIDFHLSGKELTDAQLANVADISDVIWLNLKDTKITNAGLRHLKGLSKLRKLHLERTAVTDAGLDALAGLTDLEYLNLYGTEVTDAGLAKLTSLKNLKQLYLWKSGATEEGAEQLKQAIPGLVVNLGAELQPVKIEPVGDANEGDAPKETLAEAQFLRVRHVGADKILSLAEVAVIEKDSGKKLHSEGKATQSSAEYDGEADRAIDGNEKQAFGENSVTHTKVENYPWWQVDLGKSAMVGKIKIWNRSDCCGDRLEGAVVELLDANRNVVWSETITEAKDGSVHEFVKKPAES
ncbi:MAG: hypothetical protein CMJ74_08115 [Planctomycetaceae bacterium]|nr:hypothetical protein [Planctomycetaceae bacterium]|tara:strand:- start:436 stop:1470 length:1035 start_codon:yes stop_codon:yes gene_type:complete